MKWIALALLIINLAVGGFYQWSESRSAAQATLNSPLNANKIVLLSANLTNETPPQQAPATTNSAALGDSICVEWRGMAEKDLKRARDAVKKFANQNVVSIEELAVERMYWVIFPPLPSEAAAKTKLNELSTLKIEEALVIKDGSWKNGISLGLFATDDAARRYMKDLEAKGVSGLRIETKPKQGTSYYYLIKTEDAHTLRQLDTMRMAFPATALIRVACKK